MLWEDKGIVIRKFPFRENSFVVNIFTAENGCRAGLFRKNKFVIDKGYKVGAVWQGRLEEHLGHWKLQVMRGNLGLILSPMKLLALQSVCALLHDNLPLNLTLSTLFTKTENLLSDISIAKNTEEWIFTYSLWELELLKGLGYGLDVHTNDSSETNEISVRSYHNFPIPNFWREGFVRSDLGLRESLDELRQGLNISSFLLKRYLHLSSSREVFIEELGRVLRSIQED